MQAKLLAGCDWRSKQAIYQSSNFSPKQTRTNMTINISKNHVFQNKTCCIFYFWTTL